jgi:hypothetical protein
MSSNFRKFFVMPFISVLVLGALAGCGSGSKAPVSATVQLSGPKTVTLGTSAQFTATVTGTTNTAVTWSVNQVTGGNAQTGTISTAGLYAPPAAMPSSPTVTITATSQANTADSQSIQVTLQAAGAISISGPLTVTLGAQEQYTATVTGLDSQAVTWSVNGTSGGSAQIGTISSSGLYTAPTTMPSSPTITIAATSQSNSTISQSTQITLQVPDSISGPSTVTVGTYAQYAASVGGTSQSLTWSVNQVTGGNAQVGTISSTGLYTAPDAMPSTATLTIAASSSTDPTDSQSIQVTLQTTPSTSAAIPTVASTHAMGTVVQNTHVIGRDGTFSALINGKSYWSFNDTAMNTANAEGQNFISNTRAWTTNLDASNGIDLSNDYVDSTGMPTEFMPFTTDETAFNNAHGNKSGCSTATDPLCGESYAIWPGAVIPVPNSTTGEAYHFYLLIQRGGAISNWSVIGVGIAHEQNGVITRPVITAGAANPTLMWQGATLTPTSYGNGGMVQGNTLYMTGCDQMNMFGYHMCNMGRVPIADILNPSAWTYYNSTTQQWVTDPTQATMLFYGGSAGNTLFFNPALNEYMTIYSQTYSNDLVFRVAPAPWGPWSDEQDFFTGLASIGANNANDYAAQPHPEFQEQNGLVQYVTYVQDDSDLGFLGQNIQLVRVTFAQ